MTEAELDEIAKRAEAATSGPWVPKHIKTAYLYGHEHEHEVRSRETGATVAAIRFQAEHPEQPDADLEFLAAARTDVPALVAWARKAREVLVSVQWAGERGKLPACPVCAAVAFEDSAGAHAADCALAALLK